MRKTRFDTSDFDTCREMILNKILLMGGGGSADGSMAIALRS